MERFSPTSDPIQKIVAAIYKPIIQDMTEVQLRIALTCLVEGMGLVEAFDEACAHAK